MTGLASYYHRPKVVRPHWLSARKPGFAGKLHLLLTEVRADPETLCHLPTAIAFIYAKPKNQKPRFGGIGKCMIIDERPSFTRPLLAAQIVFMAWSVP